MEKNNRMKKALEAAIPRQRKRTERLLLVMTPEERKRLDAYAKAHGEPRATAARNLILGALEVFESDAE